MPNGTLSISKAVKELLNSMQRGRASALPCFYQMCFLTSIALPDLTLFAFLMSSNTSIATSSGA